MKYTLAIAALLGNTQALKAYTATADKTTGWAASEATGKAEVKCQDVLREQKTAVWHYYSKKLYKVADASKLVSTTKAADVACKEAPVTTDNKCSTAHDAPKTIKTGYAYIKSVVAQNGNKIIGFNACPQELDRCPGEKWTTLEKGTTTETKFDLTIKDQWSGCSYVIEAKCDAPYVVIDTKATGYAAGNYDKLTFSVVEWDGQNTELFTTADTRKFSVALTDFTKKLSDAQIKKTIKDEGTVTVDAAGNGKNQRTGGRKANWFRNYDNSAANADN